MIYKRVRVAPDGSCLFTSLRLGFELLGLLKGPRNPGQVFSGHDPSVLQSAQRLRAIICNFYSRDKWDLLVSEGTTRKSILQAELSNKALDVTDDDINEYLVKMKRSDTWGSQPEYIAFAYMARVSVNVHVITASGLSLVDTFGGFDRSIDLLFLGNHYDLLVKEEDAKKLCEIYPEFESELL